MICKVLLVETTGALSKRLPELFRGDLEAAGPVAPAQLLEAVRELEPRVALVEIDGPSPEAQRAIEAVMAEQPVPVLLVVQGAEQRSTAFELLAAGALDVFELPARTDGAVLAALRRQILLLSKVSVVRHPRGRRRRKTVSRIIALKPAYPLVAIAASLGGPRALAELLGGIPSGFGAPIVVCQHITPGFSDDLARWLQAETGLKVHEAADGQPLAKGEVFIAPAHLHLLVTAGGTLKLDDGPEVGGFKPACDVLLKSVAQAFGARAVGVVLTGMGKDGAKGLKEIRARGGRTVAQDEASCVVFGMPKEAIAAGAVEKVMPLAQIAAQLARWVA
ncbi:MAG: chemotaxis protein CheB [Myxococcales bacterium]|nr:chemotaxis protein CheB [Myxococcales bacterium]